MDVLDVGAQVLQRLLRALVHEAVGVVHVPQRGHVVGRKVRQKVAQALGVGVDAVGLHQQRDPAFFRSGMSSRSCDLTASSSTSPPGAASQSPMTRT